MITYFDTSAFIPLVIDEPVTDQARDLWRGTTRVVSSRLLYAEVRAGLARARRMRRLSARGLASASDRLVTIIGTVDHLEVTERLVRAAGDLAERLELRDYDAVHLASALEAADPDVVFVTRDARLATAARRSGLAVALLAA